MRTTMSAALLALLISMGTAQADPAAVRATIEAQLNAFRANDAATAFSFAAPRIKTMFGTPERFIQMVERGYRPVYEANEPTFLRTRQMGDGTVAQEVGLIDNAGEAWTALYTVRQQPDGAWRITGCYLRKADGEAV